MTNSISRKIVEPRGDCFEAAFSKLFEQSKDPQSREWVLVHGNLAHLPQDEETNHAWVENSEFVFDFSNGSSIEMPVQEYYAMLSATNIRKYSPMEAMAACARTDHYGPWAQE